MNNHMLKRFIFFMTIVLIPIIFGWWLFSLALLYVYAVRKPFELIVSGFLLDTVYYFGNGFFRNHALIIFSLFLVALILFLDSRIYWRKFM
jgi:hypothetical protein